MALAGDDALTEGDAERIDGVAGIDAEAGTDPDRDGRILAGRSRAVVERVDEGRQIVRQLDATQDETAVRFCSVWM